MSYFNENQPSNKIKLVGILKSYIVNVIKSNQEIKRYTKYLTKTPLFNKGKTYRGELLNQPDLNISLLEDLPNEKDSKGNYKVLPNVLGRNKSLVPYIFDEDLMKEDQVTIFVFNTRDRFYDYKETGDYHFRIIVAYNKDYNILEPYGDERSLKICEVLSDYFDDEFMYEEFIDKRYKNVCGDVKFQIEHIEEIRISKLGYLGRIMDIIAKPITDRRIQ